MKAITIMFSIATAFIRLLLMRKNSFATITSCCNAIIMGFSVKNIKELNEIKQLIAERSRLIRISALMN